MFLQQLRYTRKPISTNHKKKLRVKTWFCWKFSFCLAHKNFEKNSQNLAIINLKFRGESCNLYIKSQYYEKKSQNNEIKMLKFLYSTVKLEKMKSKL